MIIDNLDRVLFLDVDGVLSPRVRPCEDAGLDYVMVLRLDRILFKTGCKIILSSAWRYMGHGCRSVFAQCVRTVASTQLMAGRIICATIGACDLEEVGKPIPRDELILRWVDAHRPKHWVALDDLDDIRRLPAGHWVQTDGAVGLTEYDAARVIELFDSKDEP